MPPADARDANTHYQYIIVFIHVTLLVWVLAIVLSTYPTLCYKEIQLSTKIRVLPSGTYFEFHT